MSEQHVTEPDVPQLETERTFDRLVDEVGGLDVGVGVLALLLVEHETGSKALGGLAFSIGFIALTLASSELFTEDFLVPVAAVVTKNGTPLALLRLWSVTIATNLAGGWPITGIIAADLEPPAGEVEQSGGHPIRRSCTPAVVTGRWVCSAALDQRPTAQRAGDLVGRRRQRQRLVSSTSPAPV